MTLGELYLKVYGPLSDSLHGPVHTPTLSGEDLERYWRVPAKYVRGMEKWSLDVYGEPNDPEGTRRYHERRARAEAKGRPRGKKARRKLRNWLNKYVPPTHFYYMPGAQLDSTPAWGLMEPFDLNERIAAATPIDFTAPKQEPFFGTDRTADVKRLAGLTYQ